MLVCVGVGLSFWLWPVASVHWYRLQSSYTLASLVGEPQLRFCASIFSQKPRPDCIDGCDHAAAEGLLVVKQIEINLISIVRVLVCVRVCFHCEYLANGCCKW